MKHFFTTSSSTHRRQAEKHPLVQLQLFEHAERLRGVSATDPHEKVWFLGEQRLNFGVGETGQVLRVNERVAAAVQSHLTVNLTQQHKITLINWDGTTEQSLTSHSTHLDYFATLFFTKNCWYLPTILCKGNVIGSFLRLCICQR